MHAVSHPTLSRSLAVSSPLAALRALSGLPHAFLLHSSLPGLRAGWSFFGADPFAMHHGGDWAAARGEWQVCGARVHGTRTPDGEAPLAPFTGGVVGYWSYDFGRRLEHLPSHAVDDLGLPDFVLGFYDVTGAFEHATGRAWLYASGLPLTGPGATERAAARLDAFAARIESAADGADAHGENGLAHDSALPRDAGPPRGVRVTFTPDGYRRAIEAVKDHIRRGDIFQANLSQRWSVALDGAESIHHAAARTRMQAAPSSAHPLAHALFESLAATSPAPFAAYFDAGDHAIASASPERFIKVRGRRVEARPIKGTRPRGVCAAEDDQLAAELSASAKDRAENVMIVDVLRNDLGRVCETGTVEVPELCALEAFPQVFHLTSTVTGTLRGEVGAFDVLLAAFPGGSITGAPKIRAMEILDALEPMRRHVYTGSVGYVGWDGDADWSIAIRTALVTPRALHFAAGGGITADSDAEAEYLETLHKAEGMRLALARILGPIALEPGAVRA